MRRNSRSFLTLRVFLGHVKVKSTPPFYLTGLLSATQRTAPDAAHALVTHLFKRAVNGLALRIKDGGLERDGDVGFHGGSIIN